MPLKIPSINRLVEQKNLASQLDLGPTLNENRINLESIQINSVLIFNPSSINDEPITNPVRISPDSAQSALSSSQLFCEKQPLMNITSFRNGE